MLKLSLSSFVSFVESKQIYRNHEFVFVQFIDTKYSVSMINCCVYFTLSMITNYRMLNEWAIVGDLSTMKAQHATMISWRIICLNQRLLLNKKSHIADNVWSFNTTVTESIRLQWELKNNKEDIKRRNYWVRV